MANEQDNNPRTGTESDISKAQSAQQPPEQAAQRQPESAEQGQFETGEQDQQSETLTRKETDVEGSSLRSEERGEAESGFVGAEGQRDTSSELVEEESDDEEDRRSPDAE